jgi:hypothetical protein
MEVDMAKPTGGRHRAVRSMMAEAAVARVKTSLTLDREL